MPENAGRIRGDGVEDTWEPEFLDPVGAGSPSKGASLTQEHLRGPLPPELLLGAIINLQRKNKIELDDTLDDIPTSLEEVPHGQRFYSQ